MIPSSAEHACFSMAPLSRLMAASTGVIFLLLAHGGSATSSYCQDLTYYCSNWASDCNTMFCPTCQLQGWCDTTCQFSGNSGCTYSAATNGECYLLPDSGTASLCSQSSLCADNFCPTCSVADTCNTACGYCGSSQEPACYACENLLPPGCTCDNCAVGLYCSQTCSIDTCVSTMTWTTSTSATSSSSTLTTMSLTSQSDTSTSVTSLTLTTTSTMTPCVDWVPAIDGYENVTQWTDSNGQDCDFYLDYVNNNLCGNYGDRFGKYNRTANEACCICGGGMNGYSTSTLLSTTTTLCVNWRPPTEDKWYSVTTSGNPNTDTNGNLKDCSYYAYGFCDESGSSGFGRLATEACCLCGGGTGLTLTNTETSGTVTSGSTTTTALTLSNTSTTETSSTTITGTDTTVTSTGTSETNTTATTYTNTMTSQTATPCVDKLPGANWPDIGEWADAAGNNCKFYEENGVCQSDGDRLQNYDMTANVACCACGGGQWGFSTSTISSATSSYCEDWRPASEEKWYSSLGESYGCSYYVYFCATNGSTDVGFGKTAVEACCLCGGGTGFTATITSTVTTGTTVTSTSLTVTTTSSTLSSTTSVTMTTSTSTMTTTWTPCVDYVPEAFGFPGQTEWHDNTTHQNPCSFYVDNDICASPKGDRYLAFDRTAQTACCGCGGGMNGVATTTETATSTSSREIVKDPLPTECFNTIPPGEEKWHSSSGATFDCNYYQFFCEKNGSDMGFGLTVSEACCWCGGGSRPPPTISNTSTSTFVTLTVCQDYVPAYFGTGLSSKWHDSNGPDFDCDFYVSYGRCDTKGNDFREFTKTASEACCGCGGGFNIPTTTTETFTTTTGCKTTNTTTTSATATGTPCVDFTPDYFGFPGEGMWYDSNGPEFNCDFYVSEDICATQGGMRENFNRTASEACCGCGGGANVPRTTTETATATETPPTCENMRPSIETEWYDSRGPTYTCLAYSYGLCSQSGDNYTNFGLTATQACCICGGGVGFTGTNTSTMTMTTTYWNTTTETITTTVTPCVDYVPSHFGTYSSNKWHDINGPQYDCSFYVSNGLCATQGIKPELANFGRTAETACCTCGGGMNAATTTTATTPIPCSDYVPPSQEEWYDSRGANYNCVWYSYGFCDAAGSNFTNFGTNANSACCVCGGGGSTLPTVTVHMVLSGLDYSTLAANTTLYNKVADIVAGEVASQAGLDASDVAVTLSAGSVVAAAQFQGSTQSIQSSQLETSMASSVSSATGTSVTAFVGNVYTGATPAPTASTAAPTSSPTAAPTRAPTPVPTAPPSAGPTSAPTAPPPTHQPSTAPTAAPPTAAPPTGAPATAAPTPAREVVVPADPTSAPTALPTAALTPAPTSSQQPLPAVPAGAMETEGQATSTLVVVLIVCGIVFLVAWIGVIVLVKFGCRKNIRRSKQEERQRVLNAPQQSPRPLPRLPPPRRPPTQLPRGGPPAVSPSVPPRTSPRGVEWDMDRQV